LKVIALKMATAFETLSGQTFTLVKKIPVIKNYLPVIISGFLLVVGCFSVVT
jgi:hypothetical protein